LTEEGAATPLLQSTIGHQQSAMKTWSFVAAMPRCAFAARVVDCFAAKAVGGFGLAFLLSAALGHNSDLDIVG
jgi:hypothetical protein